jgi:hypothetical protein
MIELARWPPPVSGRWSAAEGLRDDGERVTTCVPGGPVVRFVVLRAALARATFRGQDPGEWTNVDNIWDVQPCLAVSGASSVSAGPGLYRALIT